MRIEETGGGPEALGGAICRLPKPRGEASYLERAVDILGSTKEERAGDREELLAFTADFLAHHYQATIDTRLRSDVRDELLGLPRAAEQLLAMLAKLSRPAQQELNGAYNSEVMRRRRRDTTDADENARLSFGPIAQLKIELAALAVLAGRAANGRVKGKGGDLNYQTALLGNPLSWLAYWAADWIHAYRVGACGVRPRPHLRVTGYSKGHAYQLAYNIAVYALGEEPGSKLGKIVERSVARWKKSQRNELLWRAASHFLGYDPGAADILSAETDEQITTRLRPYL
jgi:hypothetical protein